MRTRSNLYDLLYFRPCRIYARRVLGDRPADGIYRFMCSFQFWRVHRFWPNFVRPRRFSERLWSRMLHDRNPVLTLVNDKLLVRDYVISKGWKEYLIPVFWSGNDPELIPFDKLPSKFVIKATHGCAYNIFVHNKAQVNSEGTMKKLSEWLKENYCEDYHLGAEWGYKHIVPSIIIEEFLEDNGRVPVDHKFYCFSGRAELLSIHFGRFHKHTTRTLDRDFKPHEFKYQFDLYDGDYQRPRNFDKMVQIADSLAADFKFMRVDLYNLNGRILFSELSPYTGGVSLRFLPLSQDCLLGETWEKAADHR